MMSARRRRRRLRHPPRPGADPLVTPVNRELWRNKTRDEDFTLNVHQHPVAIWRPVAAAVAATLVLIILLTDDRLPLPVLLAFLGTWAYAAWREVERRHNSFAATNKRVMMVVGLINRSVPMMRLGKVTDMRLDQPLAGRLLGYGTITIESAGQDQAIRELRYAPHPTEVFRRLNETIFGDVYDDEPPEPGSGAPIPCAVRWLSRQLARAGHAAGGRVTAVIDKRRSAPGAAHPDRTRRRSTHRGATGQPSAALTHRPSGRDVEYLDPAPPIPLRHRRGGEQREGDPTGEIPVSPRGMDRPGRPRP